jgi:hypothetical protein
MPHDKIEDLIRKFTRDIEALVRSQLRAEVDAVLEACLAVKAPAPRARGPGRRRPITSAPVPEQRAAPPAAPSAGSPAPAPGDEGKRRGWTREAVVAELATWLLTGTVIEAAFLTRHGKPGLVAAARKHFGRFDAALNAANVHLARLHPEGPPTANRRPQHLAPAKPPAPKAPAEAAPPAPPTPR